MYYLSSMFLRDEMKHVAFRLESLIIRYCSLINFFCVSWFVSSQKDSIKFMSVDEFGFDMIKFLMSFTELKTLKLSLRESYTNDEEEMMLSMKHIRKTMYLTQVEELEIYNYCHNFIHHFPKVRKLKIQGNDLDLYLWHCRSLDELTVITKSLKKPLQLNQHLKKLVLIIHEYPTKRGPFLYDDNKLEELKLVGASNLDWLKDYLEHKNTNLKRLWIERCEVTEELRELFKVHGNKIERLEIIEQDGMEIEALNKRYI